ncbi:MAG: ATP-dependent protease LonB [Candidatus Woesearchaeota archaeon]|nr:MAG: ATP-dependent protease LonB [Candidatus Woesearchaeota archaeon]
MALNFKTTEEIEVPKKIVDQVIGQDNAVNIIKKAAKQRRHCILIGTPGTGKSMLGLALAEMLPKGALKDVLCLPNLKDEDVPIIKVFDAGKGSSLVEKSKSQATSLFKGQQFILIVMAMFVLMIPWWLREEIGDIMAAASLIAGMMFVGALALSFGLQMRASKSPKPKILIDNSKAEKAPFIDATGAHAGALLGDVKHDPLQSGGLGTPANLRVQAGAIHKANKGVLFIDEVATLKPETQQELLTALQEKKYPITGQSERSSGAMVRTDPVPCDFILIAAGNPETIQKMHPALRSRIRGYGYEIYMNDSLEDTPQNREFLARFVAQEVKKDEKIPHFTKEAVNEIIKEAKRRGSRKGHLTLVLRDLGGLVRAAGDLALEDNSKYVKAQHVISAKKLARPLEQQIADEYIERKKEYQVIQTKGSQIGRVNGLAVMGSGEAYSGLILPIEAEVTTGGKKEEFIATGKLGEIAKEAISNVSAIIKKHFGKDLKEKYDVYVQFLQTYEGLEGDSASIAVAIAILSALMKAPIKQDIAMTGSLSIRGEVLPVGGVNAKVEAAVEAGMQKIIIPASNREDITLDSKKIEIIPVKNVKEVIKYAFSGKEKERILNKFK